MTNMHKVYIITTSPNINLQEEREGMNETMMQKEEKEISNVKSIAKE